MQSKKGQAAIEFFVYIGFFLLIFVVASVIFISQQSYELKEKEFLFVKETAGQFADYVNFAVSAGDGYSGTFSFPETIFEGKYDVKFGSEGYIYINWTRDYERFDYVYPTNCGNYTVADEAPAGVGFDLGRVDIDESKGSFTLINKGGVIHINQTA